MFETKGSIKAPVKELKKALNQLKIIVKTNPIITVLENVMISDIHGKVCVLGSDLQTVVSIVVDYPCASENNVTILLEFARLSKLVSQLKSEFITLTPQENSILIECEEGQFWIDSGIVDNFPKTPIVGDKSSQHASIGSEILKEGISIALPSCSYDDLRPAMTGIKVEHDGLLHFTSTDGARLSSCSYKQESAEDIGEGFIIQRRLSEFLLKTLQEGDLARLSWTNANIKIEYDNYLIVSRLIDERYPDWKGVIPKEPHTIERAFNTEEFNRRIGLAGLFSNHTTHQIKLHFKGDHLSLSSEDLDFSSKSSQRIELNIPCDNEFVIGFNARILSEILKPYKGQFLLTCWQPNKAAMIYPSGRILGKKMYAEDFFHLIMPVMLNTY